MKYRSRISVLLTAFILCLFANPVMYIFKNNIHDYVKIIAIAVPIIFSLLIIATINYKIVDNTIEIRALWFKMWSTIDIARIKTIKRSYNPLSSPAASLKRLEIKFYNKGRVETALISPVREREFIEKLKAINPNLVVKVAQKQSILRFWDWDI